MFGAVKPHWFKKSHFDEKLYLADSDDGEEDEGLLQTRKTRSRNRTITILLATTLAIFVVLSLVNVAAIVKRLTRSKQYKSEEADFIELSLRPMVHMAPARTSNTVASQEPHAWECGSTVAAARSRGCPFDVISNLWTPPRCYNATFAEEALIGVEVGSEHGGVGAPEFGLGGFAWFQDEELSRPIYSSDDLEDFLTKRDEEGLPLEAYTSMSFHAAHCSYLARVATNGLDRLRRGETDVWVPAVAADPHHARHCEHVFGELYRLGIDGARRDKTGVGFGIAPCVQIG